MTGTGAKAGSPLTPAQRYETLRTEVLRRQPEAEDLRRQLPPDVFLEAFEAADPFLGYHHVPPQLQQRCRALAARFGAGVFSACLELLLLDLMEDFERRFAATGLPDRFVAQFASSFSRIAADIGNGTSYAIDDDIFLKDLGICRLTLVPCVTHLIYRHAGVPRRLILRQPVGRALRAVWFLARAGGVKPFIENHVHVAMRDNFTQEGRIECYRLVAALLKVWPESRGLVGSSWYYDPALAAISPNIAYLRRGPEAAGALFLDNGGGAAARGALSRSPTRRRLHEEGRYQPRNYFMIWARRDILRYFG